MAPYTTRGRKPLTTYTVDIDSSADEGINNADVSAQIRAAMDDLGSARREYMVTADDAASHKHSSTPFGRLPLLGVRKPAPKCVADSSLLDAWKDQNNFESDLTNNEPSLGNGQSHRVGLAAHQSEAQLSNSTRIEVPLGHRVAARRNQKISHRPDERLFLNPALQENQGNTKRPSSQQDQSSGTKYQISRALQKATANVDPKGNNKPRTNPVVRQSVHSFNPQHLATNPVNTPKLHVNPPQREILKTDDTFTATMPRVEAGQASREKSKSKTASVLIIEPLDTTIRTDKVRADSNRLVNDQPQVATTLPATDPIIAPARHISPSDRVFKAEKRLANNSRSLTELSKSIHASNAKSQSTKGLTKQSEIKPLFRSTDQLQDQLEVVTDKNNLTPNPKNLEEDIDPKKTEAARITQETSPIQEDDASRDIEQPVADPSTKNAELKAKNAVCEEKITTVSASLVEEGLWTIDGKLYVEFGRIKDPLTIARAIELQGERSQEQAEEPQQGHSQSANGKVKPDAFASLNPFTREQKVSVVQATTPSVMKSSVQPPLKQIKKLGIEQSRYADNSFQAANVVKDLDPNTYRRQTQSGIGSHNFSIGKPINPFLNVKEPTKFAVSATAAITPSTGIQREAHQIPDWLRETIAKTNLSNATLKENKSRHSTVSPVKDKKAKADVPRISNSSLNHVSLSQPSHSSSGSLPFRNQFVRYRDKRKDDSSDSSL